MVEDICSIQQSWKSTPRAACSAHTTQRNFMFLLPSEDIHWGFYSQGFVQSTPKFTSEKYALDVFLTGVGNL